MLTEPLVGLNLFIFGFFVTLFFAVWLWAMWIAFTQGDDCIARFGRKILQRNK